MALEVASCMRLISFAELSFWFTFQFIKYPLSVECWFSGFSFFPQVLKIGAIPTYSASKRFDTSIISNVFAAASPLSAKSPAEIFWESSRASRSVSEFCSRNDEGGLKIETADRSGENRGSQKDRSLLLRERGQKRKHLRY